ncbi:hypothetical protein BCR34DRAFT_28555 [Clohesyomyces aquaticus]|uniref:C2H2-type domain-containing protein n=1 Tax=Clohesyomyces aquaticus TaxID=1231657 RepID=A0A1Y1ZBK4_9PLEO|nr:hypothetical protein BCR34DRAFT_28555 [Clohesyomyces aquaticus]
MFTKEYVWYCSNCGDGPMGMWNPSCSDCGERRDSNCSMQYEAPIYRYDSPISQQPQVQVQTTLIMTNPAIPSHDAGSNQPPDKHWLPESPHQTPGTKFTDLPQREETPNCLECGSHWDHNTTFASAAGEKCLEAVGQTRAISAISELQVASKPDHDGPAIVGYDGDSYLTPQPPLQEMVQDFAERIVNSLHLSLDWERSIITCTGGGRAPQNSSSSSRGGDSSFPQDLNLNNKRSRHQKSRGEGGGNGSAGDGDGKTATKRSRHQRNPDGPRLACLFYKRSRRKCVQLVQHRCCSGPGWKEIHQVKEHLKRCHRVFQCPRCSHSLPTSDALKSHLRKPQSCAPREDRRLFAINQEKWELVDRRVRPIPREDQWKSLFQIIFPEVPESEIPSPCESLLQNYLTMYSNNVFSLHAR